MEYTKERNRVRAVNLVFFVSMLIAVLVAFLPLDFLLDKPAVHIVFSQVILVLPSVVYMKKYGLSYTETVRFKKMKFADMALCLLFGILIQPLLTLLNAVSMVFSTNTTSFFMVELSNQTMFPVALILMAVVPAVLEESVYRGVFYNEYSKVNPWKAALLSGFLFGLMHGNINQFCYAAVMGILFALLVEATGSILSTMIIHFWINAGSVTMIYLYPKLYEVMQAFHRMYVEYDNKEMVQLLETAFGDMTLSSDAWMEQLLASSSDLLASVPAVLSMYAPQAIIMSVAAFFVYRKLAMRNGNWERICGLLGKRSEQKLITVPLAIAVAVGIAFMIFWEILIRSNK